MRYPLPADVEAGITALIDPAAFVVDEPIAVGEAKLPNASDNCAVKIFPPGVLGRLQVPLSVYETVTAAPWQKAVPVNVGALMFKALMVMLDALGVPFTGGVEAFTRIRYAVPCAVPTGIVPAIVPELAVDEMVPNTVPEEKLPEGSDNSAV
jgi:hypothetical protein